MRGEDALNCLVGRTINAMWLSRGEDTLTFATDVGPISLYADGECCSESWFADFTGVDALLGNEVVSCDMSDLYGYSRDAYDTEDGRGRQEDDKAYGFKLASRDGVCQIVFRNSSNGYYGGSLERTEEHCWHPLADGLVHTQAAPGMRLCCDGAREITEDLSV